MRAPDYTAPLYGVREWKVGMDHLLYPLISSRARSIKPGEVRDAVCNRQQMTSLAWMYMQHAKEPPDPEHDVPERGCTCGYHAWINYRNWSVQNFPTTLLHDRRVVGVAAASGKIWPHEHGFRALRMWPAAVFVSTRFDSFHNPVAKKYDIPLLSPWQFEEFVADRGGVLLNPLVEGEEEE